MGSRRAAGGDTPAPAIVFAHANGFPAGTYRVMFEAWRAAGYSVHALDKFGHDPRYPVTNNWPRLRDQLLAFMEQTLQGPAYLVGHSLGGLLSLQAACKRPALARGVVMLDSPVITGWRAHSLQVAKATRLIERLSPGKVSSTRRHDWPTMEAVHAHYAAKAAFARWDPRVLRDYVAAGFEPGADGRVSLGFRREVETRIYNTIPHQLGSVLRRHPPQCPVAFIAGTQSAELRQGGVATVRALAQGRFVWAEGTHLYPMERPDATAAQVLQLLGTMG